MNGTEDSSRHIPAFLRQLEPLHRALGIPRDYAAVRGLAAHLEAAAADLVAIGINDEGCEIRLILPAATAWHALRAAASSAGVQLVPVSGFRSIGRQAELIRVKLAAGIPLAAILRYVAAPGFSEHHRGRALDLGSIEHSELDEDFARTAAFRWLSQHANSFGFCLSYPAENCSGFGFEPWHWCWNPRLAG